MARAVKLLVLMIILIIKISALAQNDSTFMYTAFRADNLKLDGNAKILSNGILQLTNTSKFVSGHAFYHAPLRFNRSSAAKDFSFSTNFMIALVSEVPEFCGHGIAFVISPSLDFSTAVASANMGLFNLSSNGSPSNHVFAVEFDTVRSPEFEDIDENHVGINVNGMISKLSAPVTYFSNGKNESFRLIVGQPIQVWIDYDYKEKLLVVTLAPATIPKPSMPLLSMKIDLSLIFLETMYVGFSAATGILTSDHYVLGWSFNQTGQSQNLDLAMLPKLPRQKTTKKGLGTTVKILVIVLLAMGICISAFIIYFIRRYRHNEIREAWEEPYGPHRFSYKDLNRATNGFSDKELLGSGGFGNVYRGLLPSSNNQIAVKKIANCSEQGLQEFVAEIVSMGRLKHRNLVQLFGYCRRKGQLLLVYDYMPNGSVDMFLFTNERTNLSWFYRFRILKDVASALLYLHEEWDQVVLHRDIKASNVMLDADMNGRLGDFGLAKFYDHGANPDSTRVVGTVGYIAPELSRTGIVTTSTDVFSFGAFMLEMACGRKPIEIQGLPEEIVLVDWVSKSFRSGNIVETSDPRLEGHYNVEEMKLVLKLGLLCSHSDPAVRPSVRQVIKYLSGEASLPEIPFDNVGTAATFTTGNGVTADMLTTYPSSDTTSSQHSLYGH